MMNQVDVNVTQHFDTIVIGAGQAGLAAGYYLARQEHNFVILDAQDRAGDSWRKRWDSMRLFTSASLNSLPGMPFPAPWAHFPTRDEMADYLEAYAARFQLPVQFGVKVEALTRQGERYVITVGGRHLEANHVVVATGAYATPQIPEFADQLDPAILQLHSVAYRNPGQLRDGPVLVVGAGNSGAEIALELARMHPTWLAGRDTGHLPIAFGGWLYLAGSFAFQAMKLLTVDTWPGRRMVRNARAFSGGHPVVRVKPKDLVEAGARRAPRVTGTNHGLPVLEDGRVLDVANVVWATGFGRDYGWIRLPAFDTNGNPLHHRGVVHSEPGLYFLGLPFQSTLLSGFVAGAGPDARHIVKQIGARSRRTTATGARALDLAYESSLADRQHQDYF